MSMGMLLPDAEDDEQFWPFIPYPPLRCLLVTICT